MSVKSLKAYLVLALMMCVGTSAWANITVTFSEGDLPKQERQAGTGTLPTSAVLFEDVTVSVDTTISGCLIVPGRGTRTYVDSRTGNTEDLVDFYGCVVDNGGGTLKLTGLNRLDSETYYFRKDYEAKGQDTLTADLASTTNPLWAYTFTGWYIEGATPLATNIEHNPTHVPAQTVFQPGDVITPQILAKNGIITSGTLHLVALWGKCCFVSHSGSLSNLGNDPNTPCTLDSIIYYTTKIADRFCNYDAYMQVAMLVGNDTIQGSINNSQYGITYKSLQTTDGSNFELHKDHIATTRTYPCIGNFRLDNVYLTQNHRQFMSTNVLSYAETTARLGSSDYHYLLSTFTYLPYDVVLVGNGGNIYAPRLYYYNNGTGYMYLGRKVKCTYSEVFTSYHDNPINFYYTGGLGSVLEGYSNVSGVMNVYCYGNWTGSTSDSEYDPANISFGLCRETYHMSKCNLFINGCSKFYDIYGGGINYTTKVGNVNLQIYNSKINNSVYIGGQYGTVTGQAKAVIKNTTILGNVYGCAFGATSSVGYSCYTFGMTPDSTRAPVGFPRYITAPYQSYPAYTVFSVLQNSFSAPHADYTLRPANFGCNGSTYYLSLAQAGSVDIELENCTIGRSYDKGNRNYGNVYGGGAIAQVLGNVSMKLKNCIIYSNVYGGGDGITVPATFVVDFPLDSMQQATYIPPSSNDVYKYKKTSYQHPYSTSRLDPEDYVTDKYGRRLYGRRKYQWSFDPAILAMGGFDHDRMLAYSPNGGGWGDVQGSTNVSVTGGTVYGSIYGGGNAGRIGYSGVDTNTGGGTTLTVDGTTVEGDVYGGCNQANVGGSINLTVSPGTVVKGGVYSGNNDSGTIAGDVTSTISANAKTVYGGGYGEKTNVGGSVNLTVSGSTVTGDVYAGSALGNVNAKYDTDSVLVATSGATTNVTLTNNTINGDVYGGCLGQQADTTKTPAVPAIEAKVFGPVTVNFNSGSARNVFGCNNRNGAPQSTVTVNIASGTISQNVYGGGNLAPYAATDTTSTYPLVTISGGTMNNVFGGGNEAGIIGSPIINFNGGNALAGIYGGCNMKGTIAGATKVNLVGGTVGTSGSPANGVFGGGYGEETSVEGNVDVTLNGTTITGDVYGGSALGNVNSDATDSTHVTLISGSVTGNIYGGGLGQQADTTVTPTVPAIAAKVYGPVKVVLNGGTLTGNVFGGNNKNGAPQSTVTVLVDSLYTGATYIGNIYGGGNQAAYTGNPSVAIQAGKIDGSVFGGGYGSTAIVTGDTQVSVSNGSTITGSVFGGGNAANVKGGTNVKITGTTTKVNDSVFGGGNNAAVSGPTNVQVGGQ